MVNRSRSQKNKSFHCLAKNIASSFRPSTQLAVAASLALTLSGCVSQEIKPNSPEALKKSTQKVEKTFKQALNFRPLGEPLTSSGENSSPSWSPDGQHLVFVSRNRSGHTNSQVYEYDLSESKEHRITYSDGDATDPQFVLNGQKIVYASTTDELKERPLLIRKSEKPESLDSEPPSDLYLSDLAGIEITRLTNHPGFDGQIKLSGLRDDEFYFTSTKDNSKQIFKFNLKSKAITSLTDISKLKTTNTKSIIRDFVVINNRFAWVQESLEADKNQQVFMAVGSLKSPMAIPLEAKTISDLQWVTNATKGQEKLLATITVASQDASKGKSQIILLDSQKNCARVLLSAEKFKVSQATLSPDQKRIAFVSNEIDEKPQIMTKWIDSKELECEAAPAAKTEEPAQPNR